MDFAERGENSSQRLFFTNEPIMIPERKFNVKQKFHKNKIFFKKRKFVCRANRGRRARGGKKP
jgi:hypothetical protein